MSTTNKTTKTENSTASTKDSRAYTWFCVVNNPEKIIGAIEQHDIPKALLDLWTTDTPDNSGAANLEQAESGTIHSHLVLSSKKQSRFSHIQRLFGTQIHIEPMKGRKDDAIAYITKTGRFIEKHHTVIVEPYFSGDIVANPGQRTDLARIEEMINEGFTPRQIYEADFRFRRYAKMIEAACHDKMIHSVPPIREVKVIWHTGASGSGKTYAYAQMLLERGSDQVYLYDDFSTGGWDDYEYQPILFIDELRDQIPYTELLRLLDIYPHTLHARYQNKVAAFSEIHIASVLAPRMVYALLVPEQRRSQEPYAQLERRIHCVIEHYVEDGQYKQHIIDGSL